MSKYIKFTEENDWEGETWNFFVPVEGNEEKIEAVKKLIEGRNAYSISLPLYTERKATLLVTEDDDNGFMPAYQFVEGFKEIPDVVDWDDDPFYKGGIFIR